MEIIKTIQNRQIRIKKGLVNASENSRIPNLIIRNTLTTIPATLNSIAAIASTIINGENWYLKYLGSWGVDCFFMYLLYHGGKKIASAKKENAKKNLFFQESPFSILAKRKEKVYNCLIMEEIQETIIDEDAAAAERERVQYEKMTKTPIGKLVISLGIPTMLSMMVTSLYNLADSVFLSLLGNDAITAAVANLLALMSIIQAIGFTFGMGSGSIVSTLLGKRDKKGADEVASSAAFISVVSGVLIMALGLIFLTPLVKLFGSKQGEILQYSREYALYILIAAPFMCMSFVLNNVLRAEGKAVLSMIGLIVGAVVNVILDPILIFVADMGISGAAIATCASQIISFFILLMMFLSKKTIVSLDFRSISKTGSVYGQIIATGFPSFCRQILASVCTIVLNNTAGVYGVAVYGEGGDDAAQAAFGVVNKVFMLAFSISLGIGQGYQPVLGYNYSAKRFDRVKSAYLFTLIFSTVLMTVFAIVCGIFAPQVMKLFSLSSQATEIGAKALTFQCFTMPLLPTNFMAGLTYQVVGNKGIAAVLSISRQGMFYLPALLILPSVWALTGVQCSQAVADVFAFLFAIPFTWMFFNTLKKEQEKLEMENAGVLAKASFDVGQISDE